MKQLLLLLALFALFFPHSAEAAPTYRSVVSGNSGSSSGVTLGCPSGLTAGDLMIAFMTSNTGQTWTPPSGWTQLYSVTDTYYAWKIADAADVSGCSFAFTFGPGTGSVNAGSIQAWSGTHQTAPIDQFFGSTAGTDTVPTNTGITPTKADSTFVMLGYGRNISGGAVTTSGYQIATNNPTWTEDLDTVVTVGTRNQTLFSAHGSRPEVTASGSGQLTFSAAEANGHTIALLNIVGPDVSSFVPFTDF